MLDLKFIRANVEQVKKGVRAKQSDVDIDKLLDLDAAYRKSLAEAESLRAEQKRLSKAPQKSAEEIERLRAMRAEVKGAEDSAASYKRELDELMLFVPNPPHESVPFGTDESGNVVLRAEGEPRKLDFEARDHVELGKLLDIIDTERGAKVSGSRFYYLKGAAVTMEFALVQLAMNMLTGEGFTPVVPPVLVKRDIMEGGGYIPAGEEEIYKCERDDLYLVGTSEQSILGMHADEILPREKLPLRYMGFSSCFRREAGSYGKDVRGIFRVHQFDKIEMFSFTEPSRSWEEHEYLRSLEERMLQELELPYQVVLMCSGDLGAPAAKKYDMEAWFPSEGRYRETHSTSNTTDFQTRRLGIRYKPEDGKGTELVHALNGTVVAVGRMIICILENYQNADGSVTVPDALRGYMGIEVIKPPVS